MTLWKWENYEEVKGSGAAKGCGGRELNGQGTGEFQGSSVVRTPYW